MLILLVAAVLVAAVGACGRKNSPITPDNVDPDYPRTYPAPVPVPGQIK